MYLMEAWMNLDKLNQIYPAKEIKTVIHQNIFYFEDILLGDSHIKLTQRL